MFDAEALPRSLTIQHAPLSAARGLNVEKHCPCGASCLWAVDRLIELYGPTVTFRQLVERFACKQCKRTGWNMAVYLVEGQHREPCGGPSPGWSLALHRMPPTKAA